MSDTATQLVGGNDPFAGLGGTSNSGEPASSPAGGGTPSDGNPEAGAPSQASGDKPNSSSGAQGRIDQLTRQKGDALRKLEAAQTQMGEMNAHIQTLTNRLESLESRPQGDPNAIPQNADWGDLGTNHLEMLATQVQNGEIDGANFGRIVREMVQREASNAAQGLGETIRNEQQEAQTSQALTNLTVQTFGSDTRNPDSELFQHASRAMQDISAVRGQDMSGDALSNYLAFAVGDRKMKAAALEQATTTIAELQEQIRALTTVGTETAQRTGEVKEAYDKAIEEGDVRGAISQLSWMR